MTFNLSVLSSIQDRNRHSFDDVTLPERNWSPNNHWRLREWLSGLKKRIENHQFIHQPKAMFDCDDTSFNGCVGTYLLEYIFQNGEFDLTRDQLNRSLANVGNEATHFRNGVSIDGIKKDIEEAYGNFLADCERIGRQKAIDGINYSDFRSRWLFLSLNLYVDKLKGYDSFWMTAFENFSAKKLEEKSAEAILVSPDKSIGPMTWNARPGSFTPALCYQCQGGVQENVEMVDLMMACQEAGLKVLVVTGNIDSIVKGAMAAAGFPVSSENIYGTKWDQHERISIVEEEKRRVLETIDQGPTLFVAGDSEGDYAALTMPTVECRLIINRAHHSHHMQSLYQDGRLRGGKGPMTLLQGVDSVTGSWRLSFESILSGKN